MKNIILYFLGFLLVTACEENSFFEDDKIPNRTITGHVKLGKVDYYPNGYHEHVLVWAEGLGIKTTTDIDGSFELVLPAANDVSSGAIVDGEYTIHFFMGNYSISTVSVKFAAGQVVADEKLITIKGELKKTIYMNRMVGVNTTVSPEVVSSNYDNVVSVEIDIIPDKSNLFVHLKKIQTRDGNIHTGLLIQDSKTKKLAYSVDLDNAIITREYIAQPKKQITINFDYTNLNLPSGTYEVIPSQRNFPPGHHYV